MPQAPCTSRSTAPAHAAVALQVMSSCDGGTHAQSVPSALKLTVQPRPSLAAAAHVSGHEVLVPSGEQRATT